MNMKIKSLIFAATAAMTALSATAADPYKVRAQFTEDENGAMVYIVNYDTKEKIDSILVADKVAIFKGEIDEPVLARVVLDGRNVATFILESGSIVVDPMQRRVFGSMLNDRMTEFGNQANALSEKFRQSANDSVREAIYNEYIKLSQATLDENADNPLGFYLFVDMASSMDGKQLDEAIAKYPAMANYNYIKKFKAAQANKEATSVGKKFVDFEVSYDGKTSRLSDYVGKGKYVLVDYWASWCGPCIRQISVLKELLEEFGDKGLEVLGVAVWDEPANTLNAIKSHGIEWPCIINAQTIPTDLYGINGIPCIILYGPDGTILSRDKQGDELKADVRAEFKSSLK